MNQPSKIEYSFNDFLNLFKSHPQKTLAEHILEVENMSNRLVEIFGPKNDEKKTFYKEILKILAFFHDLGKISDVFQKRMSELESTDEIDIENQKNDYKEHKEDTRHSIYSAFFFSLFSKTLFEEKKLPLYEKEKYNNFSFDISYSIYSLIFYIIKHHHSGLTENFFESFYPNKNNILEDLKKRFEIFNNNYIKKEDHLKKLIKSFKNFFNINKSQEEIEEDIKLCLLGIKNQYDLLDNHEKELFEKKKKLIPDFIKRYRELRKEKNVVFKLNSVIYENFIDFLFIYSIFVVADKLSAVKSEKEDIVNQFFKELERIYNKETYDKLYVRFSEYFEKFLEETNRRSNLFKINKLRTKEQKNIIEEFEKNKDKRIFKISLPTGMGKTYVAMEIALRVSKVEGIPIVYSLPYVNLIDQIYYRFESIFNNIEGNNINKVNVTEFHHLLDVDVLEKMGHEKDSESLFHNEIINFSLSPIAITSFVQVFDSIFTTSKRMLVKIPIIFNSFLILDEIQSIDPKNYTFIEEFIFTLIRMGFRIRILVMSATLPVIFAEDEKSQEYEYIKNLTPNISEIQLRMKSNKIDRYKIIVNLSEKKDIENYSEWLVENIKNSNHKKILILTNRVKSSIYIYKKIKEKLGIDKEFFIDILKEEQIGFSENSDITDNQIKEILSKYGKAVSNVIKKYGLIYSYKENKENNKKIVLIYLASNLINYVKRQRAIFLTENLKDDSEFLKTCEKIIVVSTQVIEAGVDVSFDIIYRDFAPLDSLIQTAGRVNRNFESEETKEVIVTKVSLKEDKEEFTYEKVYPGSLIQLTINLIANNFSYNNQTNTYEIRESDLYYSIIAEYEKKMKELRSPNYEEKSSIEGAIRNLEFEYIERKIKVIEGEFLYEEYVIDPEMSVFKTINELLEVIKNYNERKRRELRFKFYRKYFKKIEYIKARIFKFTKKFDEERNLKEEKIGSLIFKNNEKFYSKEYGIEINH